MTVQIDSVCLDCGEPAQVEVKDGRIESRDPDGIIGFVALPFARRLINPPYAGSTMNFFRPEDHLRRWDGYDEKLDGGKIGLDSLIQLVGQPYFTNRGGPDYVSQFSEYMQDLIGELDNLPDAGDFFTLSLVVKAAVNTAFKLRML